MTNEERKLALYCLKASSDYHSEVCEECIKYPNCDHTIQDDVTETIIKALNEAIESLEAWDKVIEELKYFYNVYNSYDKENLTKDEYYVVSLGKRHYKHALYIINKHLGGADMRGDE